MTHDIAESPGADDETRIRELIERWAGAVHDGDLDTVLADHAEDIVMFDVPPPEEGVRGIGAYSDTWPPFFEWQRQGAVFDVVSLDVTAGEDVAFARPCSAPGDQRRDLVGGLDGGSRGQGPGEGALLAQVGASGAAAADGGLQAGHGESFGSQWVADARSAARGGAVGTGSGAASRELVTV